jgi:hypothetical protein
MKEKHARKLAMYENVMAVMDKHLPVWKRVREMSKANDMFVRNYKKLTDLKTSAEKPVHQLTDQLADRRAVLTRAIARVIGVISLYAADTKNKPLRKRTSISGREIEKLSNKQLRGLVDLIVNEYARTGREGTGQENILREYGVTPDMINDLEKATADLVDAARAAKAGEKTVEEAREGFRKVIARNDQLLKTRMDRFIKLFEQSHGSFFRDYQEARSETE